MSDTAAAQTPTPPPPTPPQEPAPPVQAQGVPTLYTPRLTLRPFSLKDAPRVQELLADKRIAATTARIPHPYPEGQAQKWIESNQKASAEGSDYVFAITLAGTRTPGREHDLSDTGHLIGAIGLHPDKNPVHARAELGYWIGVPYWSKGFATEAAHAVLRFAFVKKAMHRVFAEHFANNPASGRVMQKLGLTYEGTLRQHFQKWGEFLDVAIYGILEPEWRAKQHRSCLLPAKPRAAQLSGSSV